MARAETPSLGLPGVNRPRNEQPHKEHHLKNVLIKIGEWTTMVTVAGTVAYGAWKLSTQDEGLQVLPSSSVTAKDTPRLTPSASNEGTAIPNKTETTKPTVTATEVKSTPEILNGPDMSSIGLKYNNATEQYQTVDNRYGAEILNAGYFAKEVYTVDVNNVEKKTGGIVLNPVIVGKLIADKIAAGESDVVPIPVDPSEGQKISVEYESSYIVNGVVKNYNNIVIRSDKSVNLVNFFYGRNDVYPSFTTGLSFDGKQDAQLQALCTFENLSGGGKVSDVNIFRDLRIMGNFINSPFFKDGQLTNAKSSFGDILGKFDGSIFIKHNAMLTDGTRLDLKPSDLLTTNNYPVLLEATK